MYQVKIIKFLQAVSYLTENKSWKVKIEDRILFVTIKICEVFLAIKTLLRYLHFKKVFVEKKNTVINF